MAGPSEQASDGRTGAPHHTLAAPPRPTPGWGGGGLIDTLPLKGSPGASPDGPDWFIHGRIVKIRSSGAKSEGPEMKLNPSGPRREGF